MTRPPRIASAEWARLLHGMQLRNLIVREVDYLEVLNDTLGCNRLCENCRSKTRQGVEKRTGGMLHLPETSGLFACREMRTLAGLTWYFSATLFTTGFARSGESLEPRGEYAVRAIPFDRQYCTSSSWTHDLFTKLASAIGTQ